MNYKTLTPIKLSNKFSRLNRNLLDSPDNLKPKLKQLCINEHKGVPKDHITKFKEITDYLLTNNKPYELKIKGKKEEKNSF